MTSHETLHARALREEASLDHLMDFLLSSTRNQRPEKERLEALRNKPWEGVVEHIPDSLLPEVQAMMQTRLIGVSSYFGGPTLTLQLDVSQESEFTAPFPLPLSVGPVNSYYFYSSENENPQCEKFLSSHFWARNPAREVFLEWRKEGWSRMELKVTSDYVAATVPLSSIPAMNYTKSLHNDPFDLPEILTKQPRWVEEIQASAQELTSGIRLNCVLSSPTPTRLDGFALVMEWLSNSKSPQP